MSQYFFHSVRFPVLVGVLFLGTFLVGAARQTWTHYWLLRDQRQGVAIVARVHGHELVDYSYRVNGREYRATERERYLLGEHRYEEVVGGGNVVIYYSSSHPWLSSLTPPLSVLPDGFFGVLVFLAFEIWFIITLINPNSRWAYKLPRRPAAS